MKIRIRIYNPLSRRALLLLSVAIVVVGICWNTKTTFTPYQRGAPSSKIMDKKMGDTTIKPTNWWLSNINDNDPKCSLPSLTENNASDMATTPFPRWNDPNGISWKAIEAYIRHAAQQLKNGADLLECPMDGCPWDMPNVLYIFGADNHSMSPLRMDNSVGGPTTASSGSDKSVDSNQTSLLVWVESRRRKLVGRGFKRRYPIMEEFMQDSLHYLWNQSDIAQSKFGRLYRLLFPPQNDEAPVNKGFLGIPLIVNFGDNRQCHYRNLQSSNNSTLYHSVPVFTLAAPKNCRYAFPIPHPAVLDTAKVYGHQWDVIMERRFQRYPLCNQTKQAVWRGQPNGRAMRQKMVYTANTVPIDFGNTTDTTGTHKNNDDTNNVTSERWFNVGFGKPLHQIDPTYIETRIEGRSKMFFEDFARYRIVLDADGSSWSERLPCLLCLNTLVAKLDPSFVDYLWPTLQPGEHFVTIANDSSNLWSVVVPLLEDDSDVGNQQRTCTISRAHQWCLSHLRYVNMIEFFLKSLEHYVMWLDQGDPNWLEKWHQLVLHNMPPEHHDWQPVPVEQPQPYFPLWRMPEIF